MAKTSEQKKAEFIALIKDTAKQLSLPKPAQMLIGSALLQIKADNIDMTLDTALEFFEGAYIRVEQIKSDTALLEYLTAENAAKLKKG